MSHEFSIIVPVLNEADCVERLVDEISQVFSGRSYEMVFVDDGSTDDTLPRLIALKDAFPELRVLSLPQNQGKSLALRSGVEAASSPLIGLIDGDGQDDPADLLRLYRIFVAPNAPESLGMVMGERAHRQEPALRRASSSLANLIRRLRLGDGARDSASPLKVLRRDTYLDLPFFNGMHRFMPALVKAADLRVAFAEVHQRPRFGGQSKYTLLNRFGTGLADLGGVAWLVQRQTKSLTPKEH